MKTVKVLSISVVAVLVIVAAAGIYLFSSLDGLVEAAIEKYGSQATQTKVEVGGVKLTLASGEGTIEGIQIASPSGFTRPQIFTLGQISVKVDPKTVTEKVVTIDQILIKAPQIFYEINDKGTSNVDVLKSNVKKMSGGSAKTSGSEGEQVKLIIRKLIIEEGEVDARIAALGDKDLSANLPRIELTDIGKKSGGATPAEVAEKVANVLIKKVGPAVANLGVEQYLGQSAEEAKAKLKESAEKAIEDKVGDKLKGLFGQ